MANFSTYGANGNGTADNAAAWASMRSAFLNGDFTVLEIDPGTYNTESVLSLDGLTGITIQASDPSNKPLFYTDNVDAILSAGYDLSNFTLLNIRFNNADTTISQPTGAAIVRFSDGVFDNHTIQGCEFTAVGQTNALKYYVTNNLRDFASNITFRGNLFQNLGQMGVEFVNHRNDLFTPEQGGLGDGYRNILFENNTFDNVGTVQYGMGLSMSGEGDNVIVRNNTFNDCVTTAIEFIGTDDSIIENNVFTGQTTPYNLVRGSGRINNNNIIRNNTGTVSGGSIFISVTNTTIENDNINFGLGWFMQGIQNITFNNCTYTSSGAYVISFRAGNQEVTDDGILRIDNSSITSNTSNPAIDIQGTHHPVNVQINCSEIGVSSGTNYVSLVSSASVTYNNTERYSGGTLQDTQNPGGSGNCLALPSTPVIPTNNNRFNILNLIYN